MMDCARGSCHSNSTECNERGEGQRVGQRQSARENKGMWAWEVRQSERGQSMDGNAKEVAGRTSIWFGKRNASDVSSQFIWFQFSLWKRKTWEMTASLVRIFVKTYTTLEAMFSLASVFRGKANHFVRSIIRLRKGIVKLSRDFYSRAFRLLHCARIVFTLILVLRVLLRLITPAANDAFPFECTESQKALSKFFSGDSSSRTSLK